MLQSVERELEAFARLTAKLASEIGGSLGELSSDSRRRDAALSVIAAAVRDVTDLEARCSGLALAIRQYALFSPEVGSEVFEQIWRSSGLAGNNPMPFGLVSARTVNLDDLSFGIAVNTSFGRPASP